MMPAPCVIARTLPGRLWRTSARWVQGVIFPIAMTATAFRYIGVGVYSLPEAERLSGISRLRIRRWMEGRDAHASDQRHRVEPIIMSDIGRVAGQLALTFADLLEVRFLDAFLAVGVKWSEIRSAAMVARTLIGSTHPFSAKMFKTDGRYILAEIADANGSLSLLRLSRNQFELRIVSSMLFAGIEFDGDEPSRWRPPAGRGSVIIDPRRSFGAPIVAEGVPTSILAASARAERSQREAARIYEVSRLAVRHAVAFERSLLQ